VNDNARLHRIGLDLETLNLQEIQNFQLPARSSNFNPTESAWDLGNTLAEYLPYPENIRELSDLFPILRQQIPQEKIDKLIRRIREVIRVRGRNTDYLKIKPKWFNLILILFNFKSFTFFLVPFSIDLAENEWNYTCVSIMIPVLPFLLTNSNILNFFGAV
jgi:hypothetical protein